MRPPSRPQRGVSLLEALVALLVLSLGLLGVAQLQSVLRQSADSARQRTEATRLARQEVEALRGFADSTGYSAIASTARSVGGTAVRFGITRSVAGDDTATRKRVRVDVAWTDRRGRSQALGFGTAIDGTLPAYSGLLALATADAAPPPFAAAPGLPWSAVPLDDGRVATVPSRQQALVLVFDLHSGGLDSVCHPAASGAGTRPDHCESVSGPFAFGHVRFASEPIDADLADDAPLPLAVELAPSADSSCLSETLPRFITYTCWRRTASAAIAAEELRFVPGGWAIGGAAGEQRVCRYVDEDAPGEDSNQHNFLVIPGTEACPAGTRAHQPQ